MSLHTTDFEVYECFTPYHMEQILEENKDRLGFYLWDVYGLGHKALLVLAFPKKLKGQRTENSSSYLYAVERIRNIEDLQLALERHGSKIGFYIFKQCFLHYPNEWWFIIAWTNPKVFEDLKAAQELQRKEGRELEASRKLRDEKLQEVTSE